jgi:Ankyrin repeats (3 copies)
MLFKNYQEFIGSFKIDENVQQAKTFLKKRALAAKKEKTKKEDEQLTPEEIRRAENNPDFLKIKDLLKDNPGYVYPFTRFFFEEGVPFEELVNMFNKIKEYKQFISTLPMPVEKYADVVPDNNDKRKGFERLGDDIAKLELNRIVKKFVDRLPGDFTVTNPNASDKGTVVPSIKRAYQAAPQTIKDKISDIAKAFDEFGKEPDGSIDHKKNKELQDYFFDKIRRYRNLNEVIQGALGYIKSANNASVSKFYQTIQNVNKKYGELNGAEIVYDENGILILEVKSYQANKELNSNTSHCITSSSYQWDNYVGADSNFNKQYYIYNFNLTPGDDKSVIGITIEPGYKIRACHTKSDSEFTQGIKDYMKKISVPFEILAPMTKEEIEIKKKRVIANKEIVKPNLSLENAKKYIEEGADPNAQQGKPLINSVSENDLDKTKYLLEVGASPNIGGAIKNAQNLDMIKLLVSYGATLTSSVFESVSNDYDAIKYLIDAGMDINFDNGLPLRTAAKNGRLDIMKLLIDNGAKINIRRFMVFKWAAEWGRTDILKFLLDELEKSGENLGEKNLKDWIHWTGTSDKVDDKQRKAVTELLQARLKKEISK